MKVAPRYEKFFEDVLDVYTGAGWYAEGNGIDVLTMEYPAPTSFAPTSFAPTSFAPTSFAPTSFAPTSFAPTSLEVFPEIIKDTHENMDI